MKMRPRIYYTEEQKALMRDRWQKGEALGYCPLRHLALNQVPSRQNRGAG